MNKITHFGLNLNKRKYEFKLVREEYAIINNKCSFSRRYLSSKLHLDIVKAHPDMYTDDTGQFYSDEWCINHQNNCLKNFDLSMKYFSLLDKNEFNNEINSFLKKYKSFKSVSDLNEYKYVSGCYIMVLDEYKQIYIGVANDIKRRIQQHWTKMKPFDRLLFPQDAVETSIMSIDSFRALDTTRIYAYKCNNYYDLENQYIEYFSPKFICNRRSGGKFDDSTLPMAIMALATMKSRELEKI